MGREKEEKGRECKRERERIEKRKGMKQRENERKGMMKGTKERIERNIRKKGERKWIQTPFDFVHSLFLLKIFFYRNLFQ